MTESSLGRMLAIFDVAPDGDTPNRFRGDADGGGRQVVDGSQLLAQCLVAAHKALPPKVPVPGASEGRTVRSAHAMFLSAADPERPLEFTVAPVREGRSFAGAAVTVAQGGRTRAAANVLLDRPRPDVVRHDRWSGPPPAGPDAAHPVHMPLEGRELRLEGVRDHNSPDETGPPVLDAWLRYDTVPPRDDLRRALLAHFTGHLSISAALRPHPGAGTFQAHRTLSTAPMAIAVSFHDPVEWAGWIRYHHESTYAGAGMAHVRGQVLTEDGRLLASFTQDAMVRAFGPADARAASMPAGARL